MSDLMAMAHRLHSQRIACNVIGFHYIHRPCEYLWLGPDSLNLLAAKVANGPVWIGAK